MDARTCLVVLILIGTVVTKSVNINDIKKDYEKLKDVDLPSTEESTCSCKATPKSTDKIIANKSRTNKVKRQIGQFDLFPEPDFNLFDPDQLRDMFTPSPFMERIRERLEELMPATEESFLGQMNPNLFDGSQNNLLPGFKPLENPFQRSSLPFGNVAHPFEKDSLFNFQQDNPMFNRLRENVEDFMEKLPNLHHRSNMEELNANLMASFTTPKNFIPWSRFALPVLGQSKNESTDPPRTKSEQGSEDKFPNLTKFLNEQKSRLHEHLDSLRKSTNDIASKDVKGSKGIIVAPKGSYTENADDGEGVIEED